MTEKMGLKILVAIPLVAVLSLILICQIVSGSTKVPVTPMFVPPDTTSKLSVDEFRQIYEAGFRAGYNQALCDVIAGEAAVEDGELNDPYSEEEPRIDDYEDEEDYLENGWKEMYPEKDAERQPTKM